MRKPKLLKKEELSKLNFKHFSSLDLSQQQSCYEGLLHTAKIITDRLNVDSKNSSMPPGFDLVNQEYRDNDSANKEDSS
ncbi:MULTISPECIES: hypothetical protein [Cysteiniphilum]|uniref:hypothetical protein n=1 Tax=Cysteiniphilum TaxID=2056696 RepID=UPI00177AB402|nr:MULTISPECIES: hypothetical protein [Cysteiniphilum]